MKEQMIIQKKCLFLIILFLIFNVCSLASETNEPKLEIKAYSSEIKVGEPLILDINVTYKTPNINSKTGEIIISGGISSPYLFVTKKGQKEEIKYETEFAVVRKALPVFDNEKKGLEYTGSLIAFYDQNKKGLLFNDSGIYSCRLEDTLHKIKSNNIEINIKPAGKQEKKAISILTGKYDMMILQLSESSNTTILKKYPGLLERFKNVVEQCGDTLIAKMAAAQLGLIYSKEFQEKHPSFETFKTEYKKGNVREPLLEQSLKYLQIGAELPDEFTIRQKVLINLSQVEYMEDNLNKTISVINEIATKYPNTKYGKQAIIAQNDEVPKLEAEIKSQQEHDDQNTPKKPIGVAMPIAGAIVAIIVIVGLVLFFRKKNPNKSE